MNRAERRQRTERIVKKRLKIVKETWEFFGVCNENRVVKEPGRLRKFNLSCGCSHCKTGRKSRKPRPKGEGK